MSKSNQHNRIVTSFVPGTLQKRKAPACCWANVPDKKTDPEGWTKYLATVKNEKDTNNKGGD